MVCADTEGFLRETNRKLEEIDGIKSVEMKRALRSVPTGLAVGRVSPVFSILQWDENDELSDYTVQKREEGCEWDDEDDDRNLIHVDKKNGNHCVVYPLKPDTVYEFRVKGRDGNGIETMWCDGVSVKTRTRTPVVGINIVVHDLRENMNDDDICSRMLEIIFTLSNGDGIQKNYFPLDAS